MGFKTITKHVNSVVSSNRLAKGRKALFSCSGRGIRNGYTTCNAIYWGVILPMPPIGVN